MNLADSATDIDRANFNELQRAYNACMAVDDIKTHGIAPIAAVLNDIAKLFPVNQSQPAEGLGHDNDATEMADVVLYFQKRGVDIIESLGVGPDDKDPVYDPPFPASTVPLGLANLWIIGCHCRLRVSGLLNRSAGEELLSEQRYSRPVPRCDEPSSRCRSACRDGQCEGW